ncbi:MAG: stage II sporulation protein M [Clostridia bacterium]|nr:stage II sporulation protein M [Clostridia bacterium]
MKRTNSIGSFIKQNRRLLLLLLLPLIGCIGGMVLYSPLSASLPAEWLALLPLTPVKGNFTSVLSQWLSSCFQPVCLLALLFFSGVSACGAPLVVLVPIFWGIGLGLSEAYYVQSGMSGWLVLAVVLLPSAIMELVALLMASSEALRLTLLMAVQFFPRSARCGGLWQDFRLYCVRFLVLLALILGAGALDVILRLLLGGLL